MAQGVSEGVGGSSRSRWDAGERAMAPLDGLAVVPERHRAVAA
ncbi:hypothetical protein [Streptomyces canarius]